MHFLRGLLFVLGTGALAVATIATSRASVPVAPYNWESVRIGAGGFVTGMTIHPLDARVRYTRTDVGNGYRWDDARQIWLPIIVRDVEAATGLPAAIAGVPANPGVESLEVDPSNTSIVYIAFPLGRSNDVSAFAPASPGALYKSTDAGLTFAATGLVVPMLPNGPTRSYGERIAVDPRNGSVLYYGSVSSGLRRSIDGGTTWTSVAPSAGAPAASANVINLRFDPAAPAVVVNGQSRTSVLYATVIEGEVFRSSDGGESWAAISTGIDLSGAAAFTTIDRDGRLYVLRRPQFPYLDGQGQTAYYRADTDEIWRYSRAGPGGTWTKLLVRDANGFGFGGPGTLSGLTIDPANPQRLFGISGGGALNRSTDGGTTWVNLADGFRYANSLAWLPQVVPNPYRANGGIYFDRDGRLWSPQGNEGVLTWKPSATDTEAANSQPRWTIQSEGIEELVAHDIVIPPGSGDKPVVTTHDAIAFFIDDPDRFTARQALELQDQLISNGIGIAYCPNAPSFIAISASDINYTGSGRNYSGYSSDGGRTWTPFASRPQTLQCGQLAVSRRGAWGLGDDHIVILPATSRPPSYTRDGGRTWLPSAGLPTNGDGGLSDGGMFTFSLRQRLLVADPFVPDKFYLALLYGPLYVSTNGGANWSPAGGAGLPVGRFHSQFVANPTQPGDLWFSDGWEGAFGGGIPNPHGLFRSTNGGANFTRNPTVDYALALALGAPRGEPGDAAYTVYVYGKVAADPIWGIFRSTDAGATWTRVAYNPAGIFDRPTSIAASWDTFGLLYAGFVGNSFVYGRPGSPAAPVITLPPADVVANQGEPVTFTTRATGAPRSAFQWQRQAPGTSTWTDVSGALPGGDTFALTATAANNGARYRVVAFNRLGSVTSAPVTLTVRPLVAAITTDLTSGPPPLTVRFTGAASGGRLAPPGDTTDDGLGAITARGENSQVEGASKAFDNLANTKWLDLAPDPASRASFLDYAYAAGARRRINRYSLTSANDAAERDPYDWTLLGSDDGLAWTPLDTRTAQLFGTRFERRVFTLAAPANFSRYRLRIDRVANPAAANSVQLAELELLQDADYLYAWTFGDGTTSTLQNPTRTYAAAGTYTATLTVADADTTATRTVSITVQTPFQVWQASRFTPAQLAAATVSGPLADPDADGSPNLLEYALALDPLDPGDTDIPVCALNPATSSLNFTFLRARADLTYEVQATSDLLAWTVVATNPGTVSETTPVTVTDPVSVSENSRRFLRLRLTMP